MAETREKALKSNKFACDTLAKSGWVTKPDQKLGPDQRLQYLGLEICSQSMKYPQEKVGQSLS